MTQRKATPFVLSDDAKSQFRELYISFHGDKPRSEKTWEKLYAAAIKRVSKEKANNG